MPKRRPGNTVKISVSLPKEDLAVLKRRARESYDGNLSAAFADAARWLRQREARGRLVQMLGGSSLTAAEAAAIDAEQEGRRRRGSSRARRTRAA